MNTLVRFIGVIAVLFCLNSCTTYYYAVVDSPDEELVKNVDNLVEEDNGVLVAYCFYGENAPILITIYNKTEDAVYVDWGSSALIIDEVAVSSYGGETVPVHISATRDNAARVFSGGSASALHVSESVMIPQGAQFVPPRSKIEFSSLRLGNFSFEKIPKAQFKKQPFVTLDGDSKTLYVKRYNEVVSPVQFRSFLTLYRKDKASGKVTPIEKEHEFYVSEIIRAGGIVPGYFEAGRQRQGDFFYVTREKGTGFAVAGIVALSIIGSVIVDETYIGY